MLRGVIVVALATLAFGQSPIDVNNFLFSGGLEILDLSHPIDNSTIYWPGNKKFTFTRKRVETKPDGSWYSANEFCAAEHGGTHLDAPIHLSPSGWHVGEIPFENLITSLAIVDISQQVAGNPDFVLQRHHMDYLFALDKKRNYTVLFRFGWSQYYTSDQTKYLGASKPNSGNLNFPGISEDVAKWISENKNVVGVGVDTASVDAGSEQNLVAHVAFASKNIFILENVNLPKTLPSNKCALIVMPMNIAEGSGAPCRIVAICPKLTGESLF